MLQQQVDGPITGPLHPPNERLLVHAGPVTSIVTHIIIGTIQSGDEVAETTKETMNHSKSGKISEGHGIFGWPLQLKYVRPIISPANIVDTPADRPLLLLGTIHIFIRLVC